VGAIKDSGRQSAASSLARQQGANPMVADRQPETRVPGIGPLAGGCSDRVVRSPTQAPIALRGGDRIAIDEVLPDSELTAASFFAGLRRTSRVTGEASHD